MQFISASSFLTPDYIVDSAWLEHSSFAFWLMDVHRPRTVVELGTHRGFSYCCYCQAIERLGLNARAYAIDSWKGDKHTGFYGEEVFQELNAYHKRYSSFSRLLRSTFDEALAHFEDGSVDLLHIDGRHFYQDIKQDFESWLPKLSHRGLVLFHDTNVREGDSGIFQLWSQIKGDHPSFEFVHGHGLGVLGVGNEQSCEFQKFFAASRDPLAAIAIREAYASLGRSVAIRFSNKVLSAEAEAGRQRFERQMEVEKRAFDASLLAGREQYAAALAAETERLKRELAAQKQSQAVEFAAELRRVESELAEQPAAEQSCQTVESSIVEARFEAVYAELQRVRRRPLANFRRFLQWRMSRELKKLTPLLSRSYVARMKRREQKNSPAALSWLTEAQPAPEPAKTVNPSGNRRKELTTRLILMLPLLPSRFRSRMVRRLRKYRVVYPPDSVPHSNPAPSQKQSQNLLADKLFSCYLPSQESWLATCKVEADIIIPVYRGTRRNTPMHCIGLGG